MLHSLTIAPIVDPIVSIFPIEIQWIFLSVTRWLVTVLMYHCNIIRTSARILDWDREN